MSSRCLWICVVLLLTVVCVLLSSDGVTCAVLLSHRYVSTSRRLPRTAAGLTSISENVVPSSSAVDEAEVGSCWLRIDSSRRCHGLYAVNVTQSECCAYQPGGSRVTLATGWSPHGSLTPYQYFTWIVLDHGAPDCTPCRTSCDGFHCGSDSKTCRLRNGVPRCVCVDNCTTRVPTLHVHRGSGGGGTSTSASGPVCAFEDGRTYRSECQLAKLNCRLGKHYHIDYYGPCQSSCSNVACLANQRCVHDQNGAPHCISCKSDVCPGITAANDRVCGSDGRTYNSLCALEREACLLRQNIVVAYTGPCNLAMTCSELRCSPGERCLVDQSSQMPVCLPCDRPCDNRLNGQHTLCGSDGQTYASYCNMLHSACSRGVAIGARHVGSCEHGSSFEYVDEAINDSVE